jgi:outer membrane immunogenic protein
MKRILLASAGVLAMVGLIGSAHAADLPRQQMPARAPVYAAPYYNWTGLYVGINGGGAFGRSRWDSTGGFDTSGGMIGGTVGYNWQFGTWVVGLEGDIDWANIKGTTNRGCVGGCSSENTWLGTARGRLGYSFDRWMPYITGGAAFGDVTTTNPGFSGATNTQVGWTAGAGVEFAIASNWTAKVEYLHYDHGSFNCGVGCNGVLNDNVKFSADAIRGGVNFRF